jgi:hypothetical protein
MSAAPLQPNGIGRAADGSGLGRDWQRVGGILAANGSGPIGGSVAAVVGVGHGKNRVCAGGGGAVVRDGIMQEICKMSN